uniref:F-box domain-containing protein n=1 Tax=Panagrellus redivivus TaxID=6233 RepID=A0A7E4VQK7_PANRE
MPFPANKLPYGFCARLSELSSPAERYKFQVAAGNFNICPPKVQQVRTDVALGKLTNVNGRVIPADIQPFTLGRNEVAECLSTLIFENFRLENFNSNIMNRVVLQPIYTTLQDCDVSIEFLRKLKTVTACRERSIIVGGIGNVLSFADTLKLFPHLDSISFESVIPAEPWLPDILGFISAPGCKLKELLLTGTYEHFATFSAEELKTSFETLNRDFRIILKLTDGETTAKANCDRLKQDLAREFITWNQDEEMPWVPNIKIDCGRNSTTTYYLCDKHVRRSKADTKCVKPRRTYKRGRKVIRIPKKKKKVKGGRK